MKKAFVASVFFVLLVSQLVLSIDTTLSVEYSVTDAELRPGGETTVTFTISNPSATVDIEKIKMYLSGKGGLEVSPTYVNVGGLKPTESRDVSVIVKADADSGTQIATLSTTFEYYAPTKVDLAVPVPITIKKVPALQFLGTSYDKIVGPGSSVKMNLTLKNNGDGAAKEIQLELNESDVFIPETSDAYIDLLAAHQSVDIPFEITIDPSAEVGIYNVPITITYLDENKGTTYTLEKNFGLRISGESSFIVSKESQPTLIPGGSGLVKLKISNSGTAPVNYLSAGFGNEMEYIGTVDSDDYESKEFVFVVPADIEWGIQEVEFKMSYKDSFDNQYDETYPVNVVITDPYSNAIFGIIGFVVSLIPLAIGLYVAWRLYKRFFKKKEHMHHTQHGHDVTHTTRKKRRR